MYRIEHGDEEALVELEGARELTRNEPHALHKLREHRAALGALGARRRVAAPVRELVPV